MTVLLLAWLKGLGLGASLIMAIGAQNAFVLGQSVRQHYALPIASMCILIDTLLIFAGVWGLGLLIQSHPIIIDIATYGGAAFLIAYGLFAFQRAFSPSSLKKQAARTFTLKTAILTTMALSLLNPHVYLDTVILLGSIGGQMPQSESWWFAMGAACASLLWFLSLVVAGRLLEPVFQNPKNWQRLDIGIGLTMWIIAASLLWNH